MHRSSKTIYIRGGNEERKGLNMHKSSKMTYIWRKVEKAKTTYIRDRKEYKSRNIKMRFLF
jgi:hypothetical protein